MMRKTGLAGATPVRLLAIAGERQYSDQVAAVRRFQPAGYFISIHDRQADIEQDGRWMKRIGTLEG